MAGFAPEQVAGFTPEWVADFAGIRIEGPNSSSFLAQAESKLFDNNSRLCCRLHRGQFLTGYTLLYILAILTIKRIRERNGITLSELAFVSGIPKPSINALELGRFKCSPNKAERIRRAVKLIAAHKAVWAKLPARLEREIKLAREE